MADLQQFSNAALAAINGGSQDAGTGSAAANAYTRSAFGNVLARSASGVGAVAQAQDNAEKAATKVKIQQLQDAQDPNKYQKLRKSDGGFEFLDPTGKPISVSQYAQVTGMTRAQALKDSENPLDQQFVNDYNNLQDLTTNINNGDTAKIQTFLKNNQNIPANSKPQDLIADLVKKYPHIFGHGDYSQSAANLNNPLFKAYQVPGGGATSGTGAGISSSDYGY